MPFRFLFLLLLLQQVAFAQNNVTPFIPGDFADPTIISDGKQFYAAGTSSEWAPHYPVYRSANLRDWTLSGYIFDKAPDWTSGSFWAPEYYRISNTYFLYYTARRKSDGISCIGVASSAYPDHGFTDHGVLIDFGKEAIDAFLFNDNGQLYISFKAYGLDQRPIELLAYKLSPDGLHLEGEPFMLLRDDDKSGMEGQSMLKHKDYYYLFYSGGNCCGAQCSYQVKVARSKTFEGPYEKFNHDPILFEFANWTCSGHGTFVNFNGGTYYMHHSYEKTGLNFSGRQGMVSQLKWNEATGWPSIVPPVRDNRKTAGIYDKFDGNTPALYWQWDWRHSTPSIKQEKGYLALGGTTTDNNLSGTVLTVRPSKEVFTIRTGLVSPKEGIAGLTYYGDAQAAIGMGATDNQLIVWQVKDKQWTPLAKATISRGTRLDLEMKVNAAHEAQFSYKTPKSGWKKIGAPVPVDNLPQWDRSPRPGLQAKDQVNHPASFDYFSLQYP